MVVVGVVALTGVVAWVAYSIKIGFKTFTFVVGAEVALVAVLIL